MAALPVKVSSIASAEVRPRRNTDAEIALRKVLSDWKGDFVNDACHAATQIGSFHSGGWLGHKAKEIVLEEFDLRKVDDIHWSTVHAAFKNGCDAVITPAQLRARYLPVAANDNEFFEPTVFEWEDPASIPVRDWIYGRHLIRRHVSATIASGAVGKTSLKIVEALALATGRPLLGQDVPKPSRVWLFNLEDDKVELRRRVSAAMIHYNIKPEDIGDRLHIDGEKSLVITKTTRTGTIINVPVVDAAIEAVEALEIDVLFVDPFISSHDAPESDSGAMDLVMKSGWVRVAREGNCAVELCHHTTKADTSSGMATAMSGRGSGAVVFACRSVMVLNPMTHEEAKAAALQSPSGYFSAKDDKQNLTLKTGSRDWYKMESVSLGNGGTGNLSGLRSDNIGVVTRWQWPTQASFVEGVTSQQLLSIQDRLKAGAYRKDPQAKAWAGYVVGEVLGLGSTKEVMTGHDKQRVRRMLDTWLKDKQLEVYEQKVNREFKEFIA
ncbi:AAA family ATPase [Bradyrhizobium erythrophlei]|uniref:Plasmid and phage replicative helicase n=1 Tax=Bradyrhizobium erythrophlei TaxID=1437360 RepID=A0A1M7TLL1_9BRAD|nr:AAA family ATPase [Bradyrhizobium erythrophlei]SHN71595.1 plasmid and phage replicative helicase [Bradyrhizobium erythrophlei]